MSKTAEITAKNRAAWDATAAAHGKGAYWDALVAGFADRRYSRFDATLTEAFLAQADHLRAISGHNANFFER